MFLNIVLRLYRGIVPRSLIVTGAILLACSCKEPATEKKQNQKPAPEEFSEAQAVKLLGNYGCLGCHSENGSPLVGPTFKGLRDRQTELSDGRTVTVDADYIRKSILDPDAEIVKGYPAGLMPKQVITENELKLMTSYLRSL